jgi:hypothetical protein
MAVIEPQHQPVTQEADRIAVGVFSRMDNFYPRHLPGPEYSIRVSAFQNPLVNDMRFLSRGKEIAGAE